ncbi:OmpH family outer membrane protein [Neoehrlichia mikurensis]|uniref:OmpH family outer membrane protein n=1 Tax=Neoehrlichia mikurensis TaxID=89586 RepID=A0A9Q9C1H2_9RICK|nr:OmpH family outer membrane protein [Neoehrlichia mikurensis]QXK91627.1 OmpH family outer membrane protein [Neoehrlichia mikurensis]QXK92838.1 OmpH family outer membrane protein [Neoehrlichia mikurensis]QXK93318.1 OmpH family outer membrane protein [Neoehrlichia mikurensis]UTO55739.1 OmpH family outer membrane protein [Neoehrlichia mikurensis]UTO56656.1 OmpH family outer membrane protein [Neoehrlichia mikurensis]
MKLKILYIVLFVTFYGFSSFATDNKSILFVNRDKIMTEALVMKDIRSQIDARRSDLQKEFSNREESLHKDEDELAKQKSILSSEAFNAKVSEFKKKVDDLQKDITNKRSELENMYISSIEQVHDKIKQISEDIAKTSNTNIVLFLMDNQVLFYDSNIDISNQVLSKLNKELSRVDIKKSIH